MADGQQNQGGQHFNSNDYYLKQQAARMLSAIQKGYTDNFQSQASTSNAQSNDQPVGASIYINHQATQQQQQIQQQQLQQQSQQQTQSSGSSHHIQVQHQQLQQQLQQVQQAQQQFQQMQQLAQMQQQFHQYPGNNTGNVSAAMSPQAFSPSRRGRKPTDKKKRRRHTWVKRPTTAYLYFVSKYRETLKEAGEVVPKAKIITQACAEKWRNMSNEEKEPFLELSRRDRERWQKDKALEKKPKDPNKPKRPHSAYFLFLADFRKNYPGKTDPAKEITKKAGEAWNNLPDQDKTPYYRAAQVVRAKWEKDVEAYKQANVISQEEKNGPLSRTSSMHSDSGHLELDSDSDSSPQQMSQINPTLLQSGTDLMGGQNLAIEGNQQSPSPVNPGTSAITSADVSYAYPHHLVAGQSSGLQFPGR